MDGWSACFFPKKPKSSVFAANSGPGGSARPDGAGLDRGLLPHLGLRLQYRCNLYQAPNVTTLFSSTKTFTHTSEPMIGAYFNF